MVTPTLSRGASIPIGAPGRGCGAAAIEPYEQFLGRPVDYVLDFMVESPSDRAQLEAGGLTASADVSAWQGQLGTRRLVLGIPACCMGTSWADEAAGRNDSHRHALGSRLVSLGVGDAVLRIAREMNGSWYNWAIGEGGQATYISGYRHVVAVLRAIPGAGFRFCWNPYVGTGTLPSSGTEAPTPATPGRMRSAWTSATATGAGSAAGSRCHHHRPAAAGMGPAADRMGQCPRLVSPGTQPP